MEYRFVNAIPTVDQHGSLAVAVGWADSFRWEAMPASLAGSVCGVVAFAETGEAVAMGRVVGDGAFYFYVQDVAVHPDHRRRGLGTEVMRRLREQIASGPGATAAWGCSRRPRRSRSTGPRGSAWRQ